MHRDDRSNLMFLLSLPLMATACPAGDDGDDSTTNNSSVGPTTDDTGPADTSTSNASADTSTSSSSADSTSGEPPGSTTEEPVDTTGEYSCDMLPPLMGPVSQACNDYAAKNNECYYDGGLSAECLEQYAAYCQFSIEYSAMTYGEACGMAYEELYACLSLLTCEELDDDVEDCTEAGMALETSCVAT